MIPEEHFNRLINGLSRLGVSGIRAQYLLLAGVLTGSRPVEWINAAWADKEKTVLRICTAKVKARHAWTKVPPMTFSAEDSDNEMGQSWTPPNGMKPIEHPEVAPIYRKV